MPPAKKTAALTWDTARLAPVVLIRSGEAVLADRAQAELLRQARRSDPQVEITNLDAATYEAGHLQVVTSPSLFGEARLVLVRELELLNDALLTDLLAYLAAPADDVWVVLRHNGGLRGKKLLDAAQKQAVVVACEAVKNAKDKAAFVRADVAAAKRKMDPEAVGALVDALGSDLRELAAATSQLLADTAPTRPVSLADVQRYYAGRIEATGFSVADAAVAGRRAQALKLLRHALATGTDPVPLVAALAMKVRALAKVSAGPGRSAKELGMAPWQIDKARRELSAWTQAGLATAIRACAAADAEVKGASRDPVFAVERAVLRICDAYGRQRP